MTKAMTKGMRWTYLGTGMTHPNFLGTVEAIKPERRNKSNKWRRLFVQESDKLTAEVPSRGEFEIKKNCVNSVSPR